MYQILRVALVFLPVLAGLFILTTSFIDLNKSLAAEDWDSVDAIVKHKHSSKTSMVSAFHFGRVTFSNSVYEYQYNYAGESWLNHQISFGQIAIPEFNQGDVTVALINPANPSESVLVAGLFRSHITGIVFGSALIVIGVVLQRRL